MAPEPLPEQLLPDELDSEQIVDLPPREALSIVDPGIFGLRNPILLARTTDAPPSTEPAEPAGESTTT
jgi:hypothetical protein